MFPPVIMRLLQFLGVSNDLQINSMITSYLYELKNKVFPCVLTIDRKEVIPSIIAKFSRDLIELSTIKKELFDLRFSSKYDPIYDGSYEVVSKLIVELESGITSLVKEMTSDSNINISKPWEAILLGLKKGSEMNIQEYLTTEELQNWHKSLKNLYLSFNNYDSKEVRKRLDSLSHELEEHLSTSSSQESVTDMQNGVSNSMKLLGYFIDIREEILDIIKSNDKELVSKTNDNFYKVINEEGLPNKRIETKSVQDELNNAISYLLKDTKSVKPANIDLDNELKKAADKSLESLTTNKEVEAVVDTNVAKLLSNTEVPRISLPNTYNLGEEELE